jgi:hypothetical protein
MPATSLLEIIHTPKLRRLESALLGVELIVLAWLVATEGPSGIVMPALVVLGGIAFSLLLACRWPLGAIASLVAASAAPRFAGTLFGLHVRPAQVVVGAILLGLILRWSMGHLPSTSSWHAIEYLLTAYVLINFFTSTFSSLDPRMTLRWASMNAIAVGAYFLMRALAGSPLVFFRAVDCLLWTGVVESAYGIFCFLSNRAFGTQFGVTPGQYGLIPGTWGTQYEANLFGSYTACCAAMFLALYLFRRGARRGVWLPVGLAVCTAGTLVSLARSAMAALLLIALLLLIAAAKKGRTNVRQIAIAVCSLAILLVVISPFVGSFLEKRFSTVDVSDISADSSAWVRIISLGAALDDIQTHPLLGMGTDSLQLTFSMRDYMRNAEGMDDLAGWISNAPVRILHDTGVVGLGIFFAFLTALAVASTRALRAAQGDMRAVIIALVAGLLIYAITFQATEGTLLAFPWVHVGLLAAAIGVTQGTAQDRVSAAAGHF